MTNKTLGDKIKKIREFLLNEVRNNVSEESRLLARGELAGIQRIEKLNKEFIKEILELIHKECLFASEEHEVEIINKIKEKAGGG